VNSEEIQQDLQRFKTEMMLYRPFFGDILLRLPIVQDDSIPTACADGRTIRWNSRFFSGLSEAQRHYVLMHEVFHTLLLHPTRSPGHDPKLWNVAADMVVNTMCDMMEADLSMTFREHHKYALGLSDSGSVIGNARDNWMALWK